MPPSSRQGRGTEKVGPDPRLSRSRRPVASPKPTGPVPPLALLSRTRARRKPRIKPGFRRPPPAHLAQAVVGRLPVTAAMLWPGVHLALCTVDMTEVPRRARLYQLATASASDHGGLDHRGDRSPSSVVSLPIAALFGTPRRYRRLIRPHRCISSSYGIRVRARLRKHVVVKPNDDEFGDGARRRRFVKGGGTVPDSCRHPSQT